MLKPPAGHRRPISSGSLAGAALFLLGFLMYGAVRPAFADVSVGSTGGGFLSFEVGGKSAGMAGAQVASAKGVTAQFWNPAGLASTSQSEVGAMHATWLGNLSYEWVGYARPLGPGLGVGSLSVAYFHMPSIQGVDEFDNPTQSFRVYDMAVTAGLARAVTNRISVGANLRLIRQNLATVTATGGSIDLGTTANVGGTSIAAVVQNLGPKLSYDGAAYPLPLQLRFGASRQFLEQRLLLAADYNMPRGYFNDARLGAEYQVHPALSLRMGYRREFGTSGDPATGVSFGLGVHVRQITADYALTPSNGFDDVHRIALGYSFGSGAEEPATKPAPRKKEKPLPPPPPAGPPSVASAGKSKQDRKSPEPVRVLAEAPPKADAPVPAAPAAPASPKSDIVALAQSELPPPAKAPERKAAPPAQKPAENMAEQKEKQTRTEFAVVLPGYQSKESAEAEMKALQLLGFRTKNAEIEPGPSGGYSIRLAQMKSKQSADDMASSLARMSFRAVIQTVQR